MVLGRYFLKKMKLLEVKIYYKKKVCLFEKKRYLPIMSSSNKDVNLRGARDIFEEEDT